MKLLDQVPCHLYRKGGRERGPPQRDKAPKFNLGACQQQQDELRVLSMLEDNSDRFAFSMEDIEPASFKGEAMRIDLNSDKPIFRPLTSWAKWSGTLWRHSARS